MIRRLFMLVALVMPLPAAAVIGSSGSVSAAQIHCLNRGFAATNAVGALVSRSHGGNRIAALGRYGNCATDTAKKGSQAAIAIGRAGSISQAGPAGFIFCVPERQTCTIHGTADIAFGADGKFYYAYGVTGAIPCSDAVFGDPDYGVEKACYTKADTGPSGFAFCVSEGRLCPFHGHADVAYGADGKFFYQYGVATAISCSDAVFGEPDPGAVKACYIKPDVGPPGYSFCVSEGQTCAIDGTADVAFGADGKFFYRYGVTGSIACTDAVFGDPDYGVAKACYVKRV